MDSVADLRPPPAADGRHTDCSSTRCYDTPRPEHGYCVDDVARALVVVLPGAGPRSRAAAAVQRPTWRSRSPRSRPTAPATTGWTPTVSGPTRPASTTGGDARLWGLGVASVHAPTAELRADALRGFRTLQGSPFAAPAGDRSSPRSEPASWLLAFPDDDGARGLLLYAVGKVGPLQRDARWPWPEPRLTYGNGAVVEALLLAGAALRRTTVDAAWPGTAGLPAAYRDLRRPPVRHAGRRPRADGRVLPVRPAADRGGRARRRVRPGLLT